MQPGRGRAGICFIGDVTGAAGEAEYPVIAGDALAAVQIGVDRAALWNAFGADQFERVDLTRHGDASGAEAGARHGQIAAATTFRIVPDARAALAGSGRKSREDLLVSLLDPNRAAVLGYQAYTVVTRGGETATGILAGEKREAVTLQLRHLGVEVVDAEPDQLPPALADTYIRLKAAGRL